MSDSGRNSDPTDAVTAAREEYKEMRDEIADDIWHEVEEIGDLDRTTANDRLCACLRAADRILDRLRSATQEPVGYVLCLHKPGEGGPRIWMTLGDSTEMSPERVNALAMEARNNNARRLTGGFDDDGYRYRVHPVGPPIENSGEDG